MGSRKQAKQQVSAVIDADIATGHVLAAGLADHPVIWVAGKLSEVADQPPMVTINLATIAIGAVRGDRRLMRTGVRMLAAHGVATLAKGFIKRNVDRARPNLFGDRDDHAPTPGDRNDGPHNSFPSGHTAGALAVALAVRREYPDAARPALVAAGAASLIQIPRGTHFPIDIVAGAAIGWAAEVLVARFLPDAEPVRRARAVDHAAIVALDPAAIG